MGTSTRCSYKSTINWKCVGQDVTDCWMLDSRINWLLTLDETLLLFNYLSSQWIEIDEDPNKKIRIMIKIAHGKLVSWRCCCAGTMRFTGATASSSSVEPRSPTQRRWPALQPPPGSRPLSEALMQKNRWVELEIEEKNQMQRNVKCVCVCVKKQAKDKHQKETTVFAPVNGILM